jgi:hypothetical protein
MDDLLPVPTEQQAPSSSNPGRSMMQMDMLGAGNRGAGITVNLSQLPEIVRSEINNLNVDQRFIFDPIVEIVSDMQSFVVKCTLSKPLCLLFGFLKELMFRKPASPITSPCHSPQLPSFCCDRGKGSAGSG